MGDLGSIPELRRSPGEGYSYLLQYSGLEKTMDCIESIMTKWLSLFFQTFTPKGLVYHGLFRLPGYCTHLFAATHRQSRSIRKYPSGSQGDKCFLFCLQCIVAFPSPLDVCVCVCMCVCVLSVSHSSSVWLFVTPWIVACQATLSMEFSRQE